MCAGTMITKVSLELQGRVLLPLPLLDLTQQPRLLILEGQLLLLRQLVLLLHLLYLRPLLAQIRLDFAHVGDQSVKGFEVLVLKAETLSRRWKKYSQKYVLDPWARVGRICCRLELIAEFEILSNPPS